MAEKLYSVKLPLDKEREALYVQGRDLIVENNRIKLKKDECIDLGTYFNSFSMGKWKKYTSLKQLHIHLFLRGKCQVVLYEFEDDREYIIEEKDNENDFVRGLDTENFNHSMFGIRVTALEDDVFFQGGEYFGDFAFWDNQNIGISICTFRREECVKKTISILEPMIKDDSWLQVLVVDNGRTLGERKETRIRIIQNRNFGGAGGFTAGMIKFVEEKQVQQILLMDDDICLETSSIERTHSFLSGLKLEYKDCFLAGAMLSMGYPAMQHENTAYWDKIISRLYFHGMNLADKKQLSKNGIHKQNSNDYAGWWYCVIPVKRIKEIGYPLPVFIKSDDMEYSIRNDREVLCLNGIGVWHEVFEKKLNAVIRFFSDRNTFILNHYAKNCGRGTLLVSMLARMAKRIICREWMHLAMLNLAIKEYNKGVNAIVKIPADVYFLTIKEKVEHISKTKEIFELPISLINSMITYDKVHMGNISFRETQLSDNRFWKKYLSQK